MFSLRFYDDTIVSPAHGVTRQQTYRKSGGTRDRDDVLSLSQDPGQSNLAGGRVIFLPDLLQTIREVENIGEILPGVPRDESAEVAVLEVIRRFLRRIQRDVPLSLRDDRLT